MLMQGRGFAPGHGFVETWNLIEVGSVMDYMRVSGRQQEQNIEKLAGLCAGTFVMTLAISAYWDSSVRLLHLFEAIPYMVALAMCSRRNKFGYALGFTSGAFWLWMAAVRTSWMQIG